MTNPKEALEWYERKRVEARTMADRDCKSCKHNKPDGCSRWDCEYEPKDMVEVVRCKDCKNRGEICSMRYIEMVGEDERIYDYSTDNGYCSWGERREGGEA